MIEDADEHVHGIAVGSSPPTRPEQRLAIAVLEEALRSYKRLVAADDPVGRAAHADVDAWFASNDTGHPFSFVSICDALRLDVSCVRESLRAWRDRPGVALQTQPRVLRLVRRRGQSAAP